MYSAEELKGSLLSELKKISEQLGLNMARKLTKDELIAKILEEQENGQSSATTPVETQTEAETTDDSPKKRPRIKRENVAPLLNDPNFDSLNAPEPEIKSDKSAEDMLEDFKMDIDQIMESFSVDTTAVAQPDSKTEEAPVAESTLESCRST
jgi:hypothetical protein